MRKIELRKIEYTRESLQWEKRHRGSEWNMTTELGRRAIQVFQIKDAATFSTCLNGSSKITCTQPTSTKATVPKRYTSLYTGTRPIIRSEQKENRKRWCHLHHG
jgi:hypothetical protein